MEARQRPRPKGWNLITECGRRESPHAPDELTPMPAVHLRVDICFKEVQQPKQFPVGASGRGDYRTQEGVTHTMSLVSPEIFVNLLLSSLRKLEANVLIDVENIFTI